MLESFSRSRVTLLDFMRMDISPKDLLKKNAALQALNYLPKDGIIGVGTGSTVHYFIEALAVSSLRSQIEAAVPSSIDTLNKLKKFNIPVMDLNPAGELEVYIDGADSVDKNLRLLKGGGGAQTREKIIAACSKKFICIADDSKYCSLLNCDHIPISIEVIPLSRSYVAREIVKIKGVPVYREGIVTDNGNVILDVYQLDMTDPVRLEEKLNNITGVVCHGLFAKRRADLLLLASSSGVEVLQAR